jgi:hypothetical protein
MNTADSDQNRPEIIYLASRYSDKDCAVRHQRFKAAIIAAYELIRHGHVVYSPVVHSHTICEWTGHNPLDPMWYEQAEAMLRVCTKMVVLRTPKWEESAGIQRELMVARGLGIPIEFMDVT